MRQTRFRFSRERVVSKLETRVGFGPNSAKNLPPFMLRIEDTSVSLFSGLVYYYSETGVLLWAKPLPLLMTSELRNATGQSGQLISIQCSMQGTEGAGS